MRQITFQEISNRRFGVEYEISSNISKDDVGGIVCDYEAIYHDKAMRPSVVTPGSEGWAQTLSNDYWHVKFDRTCGDNKNSSGWEIASYIGSGGDDIDHISRLARYLSTRDAKVNTNCGLHVHVEVNDFSAEDMGVMLSRWLKIESVLISICHHSRNNNKYCMPLRRLIDLYVGSDLGSITANMIWYILRPRDLGIHSNCDKRVTLNTVGFATHQLNSSHSRNTVELRLPECLLDEVHARNWIQLIINFVEVSKRHNEVATNLMNSENLEEILMYLGLSGQEDFFILDGRLLQTKVWFLNSIIQKHPCQDLKKQASDCLKLMSL